MGKRSVFDELMEGIAAMRAHREGNLTLHAYRLKHQKVPTEKPVVTSGTQEKPKPQGTRKRS
jgi:hypothetical protein